MTRKWPLIVGFGSLVFWHSATSQQLAFEVDRAVVLGEHFGAMKICADKSGAAVFVGNGVTLLRGEMETRAKLDWIAGDCNDGRVYAVREDGIYVLNVSGKWNRTVSFGGFRALGAAMVGTNLIAIDARHQVLTCDGTGCVRLVPPTVESFSPRLFPYSRTPVFVGDDGFSSWRNGKWEFTKVALPSGGRLYVGSAWELSGGVLVASVREGNVFFLVSSTDGGMSWVAMVGSSVSGMGDLFVTELNNGRFVAGGRERLVECTMAGHECKEVKIEWRDEKRDEVKLYTSLAFDNDDSFWLGVARSCSACQCYLYHGSMKRDFH